MASPLAYAAAGAARGFGLGLQQDILEQRRMVHEQLAHDRALQRDEISADRQHKSRMAELTRSNELSAQSAQDADARRLSGDLAKLRTQDELAGERAKQNAALQVSTYKSQKDIDAALRAGEINSTQINDQGNIVVVMKNGSTKDTGVKAQAKTETDTEQKARDYEAKLETTSVDDPETFSKRSRTKREIKRSVAELYPGTATGRAAAEWLRQHDEGGAPGTYKSADDVRAAYRAGSLTRDQAAEILRRQFGMK